MPEDETQLHHASRAPKSWRSRNKPAEIVSAIAIVAAGAFAIYWYMPTEIRLFRRSAPEVAAPLPPARLSADTVKPLLERALANAPVVLRVPLGDVVTVTSASEPIPIYSTLAEAGLIRLRFCRFPGTNGPGKEVCLADLTEKGREATASGTPSLIIKGGADFPAANRSYAQFVVAQPKVKEVADISEHGPNEATISYEATVQPTALASMIPSKNELPPVVSGRALARRAGPGWQVTQTGLAGE